MRRNRDGASRVELRGAVYGLTSGGTETRVADGVYLRCESAPVGKEETMRWVTAVVAMMALCALPARGAAVGGADDAQRIAEIQAQMMAGNTEKAMEAARAFLKTAKQDEAKTEARQIIAEGLRKSGNWDGATGAYRGLRDCYEKGSDEYVRYGAIADVLAGSKNGVFMGGGKTKPAAGAEAKKLSDDEALEAALALLAKSWCAKLKGKGTQLRRTRSPQEVVRVFGVLAEEARQIFLLGPDTPPGDARALGKTAAQRLAQIHTQVTAVLQKKLGGYQAKQKFKNPWSFTNVEKKDVKNANIMCKEMAAAEKEFQAALANVTGSGEWAEGDAHRSESTERAAAYEQLAGEFVVPPYSYGIGF